jgi:hypothetical protein
MAINRPVTKTIISTPDWGIPITDEVNRLTAWQLAQVPTVWYTLVMANGWTAAAANMAPQYRKQGDLVNIRGTISGGAPGSTIATLPVGFRPVQDIIQVTAAFMGTWQFAVIQISTNGVFIYHPASPAGATYMPIQMLYSTTL